MAAGAVALPALLKLSGILSAQGQDITRVEQLPVELALGKVRGDSWTDPVLCATLTLTLEVQLFVRISRESAGAPADERAGSAGCWKSRKSIVAF